MATITLAQARVILAEVSNGSIAGISGDKGGRAWLDGEFLLPELEALCVVLRHETVPANHCGSSMAHAACRFRSGESFGAHLACGANNDTHLSCPYRKLTP